jgi:hypothetical protein
VNLRLRNVHEVLPGILNGGLDIEKASAQRALNKRWQALDDSAGDEAAFTFNALLKTDPQKAYEYGKMLLVTST